MIQFDAEFINYRDGDSTAAACAEKQRPCETSRDGQAAAAEFGQHHVDNAAADGGDRTSGCPGPRAGAVSTGCWQQAATPGRQSASRNSSGTGDCRKGVRTVTSGQQRCAAGATTRRQQRRHRAVQHRRSDVDASASEASRSVSSRDELEPSGGCGSVGARRRKIRVSLCVTSFCLVS